MLWANKVVWSEGMLLQQQHLQQHDRYLHRLLEMWGGVQRCDTWGVARLAIDESQLRQGRIALLECEAVLPDGTPLSLPQQDDLPLPLAIDADMRDCEIVLALPLARPGTVESGEHQYARYRVEECEVADSHVGGAEPATLQVGKLRLRLAAKADVADAYSYIGVARVLERRADNRVVLDEEYVPPCIDYRAAPLLARFVAELVGRLHQRGDALAARLTQTQAGNAAKIADFLLLQLVNRCEPLFAHLQQAAGIHPERLFAELVQLAGELASFQRGKRPSAFPPYRHHALDQSFGPLIVELRQQLSLVTDPSAVAIPLQVRANGLYVAVVPGELYEQADFVLAAKAALPDDVLTGHLPTQLKMGPVEKISDLVNLQLPAIGVRALASVPYQIPLHAGYRYFALERSHALWAQLPSAAALALHVAGDFPGLELELWAIRHKSEHPL
ncbi:type VI secretion system baseplate subunit TssK [Paludibacterium purpuratum]|uniref:Type VI secretion system protein ImpJ n=1 Tax=Paludibacterium purpuratum TaxID=1144873 RepID=A0A4R7B478_9NEIS|nr:type VI secretion system baseplate subunit TssK [Paludibacterium purpuratum]TDR78371.1 type VI secretion system protein ImpJ [Paludibacterium purpuratum]